MKEDKEIFGISSEVLADAVRPAIINNTIISVRPFEGVDRGIVLLFANGTELGFAYSADEGGIFMDTQRRYDQ